MKEERRKKKKPEGYIDLFADDDEEEAAPAGSLFDDDEEDLEEAEAFEEEEAPAEGSHSEDEGPAPADDEDEAYPDEAEEPLEGTGDEPGPDRRETFTFDRFGRRQGKVPRKKRPKERYGKRKHAKKATTTLLLNETEVRREREEAQKRAQERDKLREKQRKMEAEQRRARRKVEAKKRLSALLVLLGLGVLALLAGYFTFLIQSIDVVGYTTRYTQEELITASGLKRQRHILQQDLDQARENLEKDPYLNTTVKYVFPNRIRITVEERNRAGAVAWGPNKEYIAVIDREGVVLESDASSYAGLPLVQGLIITGANPGTRVGDPADEQVQSMLDVLSTLEELGLADKIKTVDSPFVLSDDAEFLFHHPSVWSAIYRRDFLSQNDIRMHEIPGAGWADNPWLIDTLVRATSIVYVDECLYYYRDFNANSPKVVGDPRILRDRWIEMDDIMHELHVSSPRIWEGHYNRACFHIKALIEGFDTEDPVVSSCIKGIVKRVDYSFVCDSERISEGLKGALHSQVGLLPRLKKRGRNLLGIRRTID